ncbi:hypothetical protein C4572_03740 [Candidatus Parcubacteria bacterium]|nr:MAG: hypothetical protein C4572_03740 [Candidatus Parcubacteria bacterium]
MNSLWEKLKNRVLGRKYDLSLFFLPEKEMRRLNSTYRKKDYPANVLSFPLSKTAGEILINSFYKRKVKASTYLFIHSLLHLKGLGHGKRMSETETRMLRAIYPERYEAIMKEFFVSE